ncbi:hypothetical protein Rsub_08293 [Raphidocelis subcapitata]|uniref:Uncharacterized protein n=1 Tax=Raphidocelis subcapitata TaxID=307507 RepID=A0A2V0P8J4_9CHLO|nr:hypothetical protein Rsub_08293 [Raphidocelis subcapitata]|eukprot:GBF95262.1 hypothetical protein Rsub_08293 [Raphidocelis subcapitata]
MNPWHLRLTSHNGPLACHVSGALMVLLVADDHGCARAQQRFVDGGGIEAVCLALAGRPRADTGRGTLRLRLLLAELCRANKAWEARTYQAAAELSLAASAAAAAAQQAQQPGGGGGTAATTPRLAVAAPS